MRLALAVVVVAAARTCGGSTDAPQPRVIAAPPIAQPPEPPVGKGEPLEATIPLLSGDTTDLGALRGTVVILELSAIDRPGWAEAHRHYRELLAELGPDALEVVAVSIDAATDRLQEEWDRDPPPFVLGWDPQGALAVRLGVKSLPTTFVLDPQGRIVGATAGFDTETLARVDGFVRQARDPARSGPAAR